MDQASTKHHQLMYKPYFISLFLTIVTLESFVVN